MFRVYHAAMSVQCSLMVICWERANILALLYVMFQSCVLTISHKFGVLSQVLYLIVLIPDLFHLPYFQKSHGPWCLRLESEFIA